MKGALSYRIPSDCINKNASHELSRAALFGWGVRFRRSVACIVDPTVSEKLVLRQCERLDCVSFGERAKKRDPTSPIAGTCEFSSKRGAESHDFAAEFARSHLFYVFVDFLRHCTAPSD